MSTTTVAPVLGRVQNEIDRVFNRFFKTGDFVEPFLPPMMFEPTQVMFAPQLDIAETDSEFVVRVDVPGIPKENVDVQLIGDVVTISGHREKLAENKGETYLWREQQTGKFSRTLRLPAPVVGAKVEAVHNDGVLTVRLPKVAPAVVNRITIK
jgi:HSP20 family protein